MTDMPGMSVLVSVHDVMPATLDQTETICARLIEAGAWPATLLVVPGSGWDEAALTRLRALAEQGAELAGHGWCHETTHIRGWYHRLHSALISRDVAEHLALDSDGIAALIRDCFDWFGEVGLPAPELYVPPAWAMGSMSRSRLASLPFRYYETLGGVFDAHSMSFRLLPMQGYEADTGFRAAACRGWNTVNRMLAGRRAMRVAIHPFDPELRLAGDLESLLREPLKAMRYAESCATAA